LPSIIAVREILGITLGPMEAPREDLSEAILADPVATTMAIDLMARLATPASSKPAPLALAHALPLPDKKAG
jgi:hypothetical protein